MSTYQQSSFSFLGYLVVFLGPIVATAVLFVLLPLLTSITRTSTELPEQTQIMIFQKKTQKAPEVRKKEAETKPREVQKTQQVKKTTAAPKIEMASAGAGGNVAGTIKIGMLDKDSLQNADELFTTPKSLYATAFALNEVDQAPKVLRSVPPQYPFLAKRNNIEGSVTLRFIVDSEGNVVEPEVTESEPEGVFDEAAIEAILKYKFKPAEKGGKAVDCIVNAPMKFQLR